MIDSFALILVILYIPLVHFILKIGNQNYEKKGG